MKRRKVKKSTPAAQFFVGQPVFLVPVEDLLDPDFDEVDEVILFEPTLLATRSCGGYLTKLTDEDDDNEHD